LDVAVAADLENDIAAVGHEPHVAVAAGFGRRALGAGPFRIALAAAAGARKRTGTADFDGLRPQVDMLGLRAETEVEHSLVFGLGTGACGWRIVRLRTRRFAQR